MSDPTNRIGPHVGGGVPSLAQALAGAGRSATGTAANAGGKSPGGRGMRMPGADLNVDQLDHSAPRGTYLDILV